MPRKTRFRLVANLYRAGLATRWVPLQGFSNAPSLLPPCPELFAATEQIVVTGFGMTVKAFVALIPPAEFIEDGLEHDQPASFIDAEIT